MRKLTDHLPLGEVIKSRKAEKLGFNNMPGKKHYENLIVLADLIFRPIREHFDEPIYISSGYRCKKLNKEIKGARNSQHCEGQALDFDQDNKNTKVQNADIFYFIKDHLDFDQLIWEFGDTSNPSWVHVSYNNYKADQRRRSLISYRSWGKIKYTRWER